MVKKLYGNSELLPGYISSRVLLYCIILIVKRRKNHGASYVHQYDAPMQKKMTWYVAMIASIICLKKWLKRDLIFKMV